MARKENKAKQGSGRTNKSKEKGSSKENRENDFESGDNPEERERGAGMNK